MGTARSRRSARRVLLVHCHPCDHGFIPSALVEVERGLRSAGAIVRLHDLYAEGFTPELSAAERRVHHEPGAADDLRQHADDLRWCDTLVFVYPTWWSGQPAMLKGWIDRMLACGVAWHLPPGDHRVRPMLTNVRTIVAVTSHGSSKLINALQGEGGKRTLFRSLRSMCHPLSRTHWIAFYGIDADDPAARAAFLGGLSGRIERIVAGNRMLRWPSA